MPTKHEIDFHNAMLGIYRKAKDELGYNATRFLSIIAEEGGVLAAKKLINSSTPSDGYTEMWKRGRLDITVEALILKEQWCNLFTEEELEKARNRLLEYDYISK